MIANNVKLSLRVFARHKLYTITSVLGLSLALAIGILISLFVRFELSFESENPLADRIVRISMDLLNGDMVIDQDAGTYPPAGPRIVSEFSGVESFTSIQPVVNVTIKSGNEALRENKVYAADNTFLHLFNCRMLAGKIDKALSAPFEIILTETAAIKYFGSTDVLGKSLHLSRFDQPFKIIGLIEDAPVNSHLTYTVLVSRATFGAPNTEWLNNNDYTYILLSDADQYPNFVQQLNTLNTTLHNEGQILNELIVAQPLKDVHLYSHQSFELEQNGDAVSVFFLIGVGILVMIIAVVNHINLSTARSLERAKEVGVRKVIGSSLNQLRLQFFTESLLVNVISVIVAGGLVIIALPTFRKLSGLPVEFAFWRDGIFYLLIASAVIFTTILSSIFPSFILASFQPLKALRGKFSRSAGGVRLRQVLVTLQFAITMFLLVQTFTAKRQLDYMHEKDLGLDIEQTVVVRTASRSDSKNYQVFKDKLVAQTEVNSVAFSNCVPGQPTSEMGSTNVGVHVIGGPKTDSFNFYITWVDSDFFPTMKIDLAAGKDFAISERGEDDIIVNEEALRLWHLMDPKAAVGQRINLWDKPRTIIGVIKNFHQASPKEPYLPMIFLHQEGNNRLASVRLNPGISNTVLI